MVGWNYDTDGARELEIKSNASPLCPNSRMFLMSCSVSTGPHASRLSVLRLLACNMVLQTSISHKIKKDLDVFMQIGNGMNT